METCEPSSYDHHCWFKPKVMLKILIYPKETFKDNISAVNVYEFISCIIPVYCSKLTRLASKSTKQ